MVESITPRLGLTRWTDNADIPDRAEFDSSHENLELRVAGFTSGTTAARPTAAAAHARFLYYDHEADLLYVCVDVVGDGTGWTWLDVALSTLFVPKTGGTFTGDVNIGKQASIINVGTDPSVGGPHGLRARGFAANDGWDLLLRTSEPGAFRVEPEDPANVTATFVVDTKNDIVRAQANGVVDLGSAGIRWRDLFLARNLDAVGGAVFRGRIGVGVGAQGSTNLYIKDTSPQIEFHDTDQVAGASGNRYWIHHNAGRLYFLQDRDDSGGWNSPHPMIINNDGSVTIDIRANFRTYRETIFDHGAPAAGSTVTINTSNGGLFRVDAAPGNNLTFAFSGVDGDSFLLYLNSPGAITWPVSTFWPDGVAPTLGPGRNILSFWRAHGYWWGVHTGSGYA